MFTCLSFFTFFFFPSHFFWTSSRSRRRREMKSFLNIYARVIIRENYTPRVGKFRCKLFALFLNNISRRPNYGNAVVRMQN